MFLGGLAWIQSVFGTVHGHAVELGGIHRLGIV
jgi:hypothetical protein